MFTLGRNNKPQNFLTKNVKHTNHTNDNSGNNNNNENLL